MKVLSSLLAFDDGNSPFTDGSPHKGPVLQKCVLCSQPEPAFEQTVVLAVIWEAMILMWRYCYIRSKISQLKHITGFPISRCINLDIWNPDIIYVES